MQRLVAAVVVAVGVNLDHERKALHSFLRGEVRAKTVHCDEDLVPQTNNKQMSNDSDTHCKTTAQHTL